MWRAHKKRKKKTACVCHMRRRHLRTSLSVIPPMTPLFYSSLRSPVPSLGCPAGQISTSARPHTHREPADSRSTRRGDRLHCNTSRETSLDVLFWGFFFYFIFLFFPWEHFHSRFCNFSGRFSSRKSLPKPRGKKQLWRQGENDDIRPDIRTLELLIKKTNCAFLSCSSGLGTLLWTVSSRLLRWDEDEDEDRTVEEEEEV